MIFATGAAAFLHLNEHLHTDLANQHQYDTAHQHHEGAGHEADHAHHFNLHVVGDLVEHEILSFTTSANLVSSEVISPLVSRTYTPPIPPPNA